MRNASRTEVVQTVGTLFQLGTTAEWSDGDLLDRFVAGEEQARASAFEVLIDRHGSMVLDVCRNVLRNEHEAEDAFQATFLILAQQAQSIRKRGSVGSWLFGVASRVAARARVNAARQMARERASARIVSVPATSDPDGDVIAALHEEIARLPEKYRQPLILCEIEGLSYQTAATRLGCPIGTVGVRLKRAREKLRSQLLGRGDLDGLDGDWEKLASRRNRQPAAPALIATLTERASQLISGRLPEAGVLPTTISTLVRETSMAISVRQLMTRAAAFLVIGSSVAGTGAIGYQAVVRGAAHEPPLQTPVALAFRAAAQVPKVPVKQDPGDPAKKPPVFAQREIARRAVQAIEQMQKQAVPTPPEIQHRWALRLLDAERATAPSKVEEIAALEEYAARMKQLLERAKSMYTTGQLGLLDSLEAEYWYNEAAAWLEKARDEAKRP